MSFRTPRRRSSILTNKGTPKTRPEVQKSSTGAAAAAAFKRSPTAVMGTTFAITGSIVASVAIVMVNKHVLGSGFPFASTLTALHQLFGYCFANLLIAFGWIPPLPKPHQRQWASRLLVAILYASGLVLMNQSLGLNSVSFYQLLKMSCIPAIVFLQYTIYGSKINVKTFFALAVILLGLFISTSSNTPSTLTRQNHSKKTSSLYNREKGVGDNWLSLFNISYPLLVSVGAVLTTSLSQIMLNRTPDLQRLSSLQSIAALSFPSFLVCGTVAVAVDVGIYPGDWVRLVLSLTGVSGLLYQLLPNGFEWLLFSGEELGVALRQAAAEVHDHGSHDFHEFLGGLSSRAYLTEHILGKFVSFLTKVFASNNSSSVLLWVGLSCLLSVLTNLFGFAVIKETSAVTYQVVGHFKTVLTLGFGAILFGMDGLVGAKGLGLLIALIGMIIYSQSK